jgi:uncharacterized protein
MALALPTAETVWLLAALFFLVASLYSSVGHAGASGYLAMMALLSTPTEVMRPTALVLNIIVSTIATVRFYRAGLVPWRSVLPLVIGAIPCAMLGGAIQLPAVAFKTMLGIVLLVAAAYLIWRTLSASAHLASEGNESILKPERATIPVVWSVPIGAAIGLLSGLSGTGGGIFLSPLIILAGWSSPRLASGIAAPFILVNSIAGLLGNFAAVGNLPAALPWYALAVIAGTALGTSLGIKRFSADLLCKVLAVALTIAGLKLVFT